MTVGDGMQGMHNEKASMGVLRRLWPAESNFGRQARTNDAWVE